MHSTANAHFGIEILMALQRHLKEPFHSSIKWHEAGIRASVLPIPFRMDTTSRIYCDSDTSVSIDISSTAQIWFTNTRGVLVEATATKGGQTKKYYEQTVGGVVAMYSDSGRVDVTQTMSKELPMLRTNVVLVCRVGNTIRRHTPCEMVFIIPAIESGLSEDEHRQRARHARSLPANIQLTIQYWMLQMIWTSRPPPATQWQKTPQSCDIKATSGNRVNSINEAPPSHPGSPDDVIVCTHQISSLDVLDVPIFVPTLNRSMAWNLPGTSSIGSDASFELVMACALNIELCPGHIDREDSVRSTKNNSWSSGDRIDIELNLLTVSNVLYELRETIGHTICKGSLDQSW